MLFNLYNADSEPGGFWGGLWRSLAFCFSNKLPGVALDGPAKQRAVVILRLPGNNPPHLLRVRLCAFPLSELASIAWDPWLACSSLACSCFLRARTADVFQVPGFIRCSASALPGGCFFPSLFPQGIKDSLKENQD